MQMMTFVFVSHMTQMVKPVTRGEELQVYTCYIACASVENKPSSAVTTMSLSQKRVKLVHTRRLFMYMYIASTIILSQNGEEEIAEAMGKAMTSLQSAKLQLNLEQTTITKYF